MMRKRCWLYEHASTRTHTVCEGAHDPFGRLHRRCSAPSCAAVTGPSRRSQPPITITVRRLARRRPLGREQLMITHTQFATMHTSRPCMAAALACLDVRDCLPLELRAQMERRERELRSQAERRGLRLSPPLSKKKSSLVVRKRLLKKRIGLLEEQLRQCRGPRDPTRAPDRPLLRRKRLREAAIEAARLQEPSQKRLKVAAKRAVTRFASAAKAQAVRTCSLTQNHPRVVDGWVLYENTKRKLHACSKVRKHERTTFTYHTEETLRGALRVAPDADGPDEQHVLIKWPGMAAGAKLFVLFVHAPGLVCGGSCRSANLVVEPGGFVAEIVTQTDGWVAVVDGAFSEFVHSTPYLPAELDAFHSQQTAARVLKLVQYTPAGVAAVASDATMATLPEVRGRVLAAKQEELAALASVPPKAHTSIAAATEVLGTAFESVASGANGSGLKLEDDDKVDAYYWPLGWGVRGQGMHAHRRCRPVTLGPGWSRTLPYLRDSTFDKAQNAIWPEAAAAIAAAGSILNFLVPALARAMPHSLVEWHEQSGGLLWDSMFSMPPASHQSRGYAEALPTDIAAIHHVQMGIRRMGRAASSSTSVRNLSSPTARHADTADGPHATIAYLPCAVGGAGVLTRSRKAQP